MTQGAIDLVQAALETPVQSQVPLLETGQAGEGPRLLGSMPAHQDGGQVQQACMAIESYSWWDAGAAVVVEVRVADVLRTVESSSSGSCRLPSTLQHNSPLLLKCQMTATQIELMLKHEGGNASYQLTAAPLFMAIVPANSSCNLKGPLLLSPAAACNTNSIDAMNESDVRAAACQNSNAAKLEKQCSTFTIAPNVAMSAVIVLRLAKQDVAVEWKALAATQLAVPGPQNNALAPDLATLRCGSCSRSCWACFPCSPCEPQ